MTEPLTTNENPHAKWLREASKQIADAGHYGWGNTAEWAADEIDRLTASEKALREALEKMPCMCFSRYVDRDGIEHLYDIPCPRCAVLKEPK
jgi:hypothetical protein